MLSPKLIAYMAFVLLVGCSTVTTEPDSTYEDLPPQAYTFDTIWECSIEACQDLGFAVADSERDGSNGHFESNIVEVDKNLVRRTRRGHRVRGKISPGSEGAFRVQVAASRFEDDEGEGWSYLNQDTDLLRSYQEAFRKRLAARYTGGN